MANNRWIGQASPRKETRFYIPDNVSAGDRFQLAEGNDRWSYQYPEIPPEQDLTSDDRSQRVVNAIVEAANSALATGLGGGADAALSYSVSNYGGKPAVRVDGASNGAPIGVVPTVTPSATNQVIVQQVQEGSSGRDHIFTLTWPTVPSAGKWAIAANGKRPQILDWNVSAANLRTALLTFNLPCSTITVTGSHSAGYTVTLSGLTEALPDQPVMFPVVATPGTTGILSYKFRQSEVYRFGADSTSNAASMLMVIFDSNISAADMKAYLSAPHRLGTLANDVTVVRTAGTLAQDFDNYTFEFASADAFDAFLAMEKVRMEFDWQVAPAASGAGTGFQYYQPANSLTAAPFLHKTRQKPRRQTSGSDTLNPDDRFWYSRTYHGNFYALSAGLADVYLGGYVPGSLNAPLVTSSTVVSSTPTVNVDIQFSAGVTAWNLPAGDVEIAIGFGTGWKPFDLGVQQSPAGAEIGVNNNAGYTVETIGTPGVINQSMLVPALDGDFNSLYQFSWNNRKSHFFTGASSLALIKDAAEAVWGAGNVSVSATSAAGYVCRIEFVAQQSERDITPTLSKTTGGSAAEVNIDVTTSTPMNPWVLRYRFTGGVCSGTWRFVDATGTVFSSTTPFPWISPTELTEVELRAAIISINADYADVLAAADIEIVTESVGRRYIIREFTITWQAQPSAWFTSADLPFWLGIDTASLKTAEPSFALTQVGAPAIPEVQVVALRNRPTSGTFTLTLDASTTASIAFNATAATVQTALTNAGISTTVIGGAGGPWRIRWSANGARSLLVGTSSLGKTNSPTFTTVTLPGTGPNHYDNVDNWSLGILPAAGDSIVFADGSADCCYATTVPTALPDGIDIYRSYTGRIGLPEIRDDGSNETLPNWLAFNGTSSNNMVIRAGLGETGEGPSICRISVNNRPIDCTVLYTQTGQSQKCFGIRGSNTANRMVVIGGDVAVGVRPDDVAVMASIQVTPVDGGEGVALSSGAGSSISVLSMLGGTAVLGAPPANMRMVGGTAIVNGNGTCRKIDLAKGAVVRWMAGGSIGLSGVPTAIQFGPGWTSSASTGAAVRFVQTAHGLTSGQRIYVRAYSGVYGIDARVYAIQVIDANTFELLGSSAYGTLTGYAGLVTWGLVQPIIIRDDCVLDFDSDGRTRDIVAPVTIQGTGKFTDVKVTVLDLRIWPELVDEYASLGQNIELRRLPRSGMVVAADGGSGLVVGGGGGPALGGGGGGGGGGGSGGPVF